MMKLGLLTYKRHGMYACSRRRPPSVLLKILIVMLLLASLTPLHDVMMRQLVMETTSSIHMVERNKSLFYVTTHLSPSHYQYLEKCWPSLLAKSQAYRQSDFVIFITKSNGSMIDWNVINATFAGTKVTVHVVDNPGYQEGAMLAMTEAYRNHWFDGYEWVIRVNPDVLIRNDTFLLEGMRDPGIEGIFADCLDKPCPTGKNCSDRLIHTDFFAIRPDAVSLEAILDADEKEPGAEPMARRAFSSIVWNGRDSWVPNAGPHMGHCRIAGAMSPVIHPHEESEGYPQCLSWYDS
ncbi:hypothetical protein Naga_100877g2 [Nannochloropsis gaditana]|uniref:Uncharacterized protein n=1 Tax=Nannochloropsis gaditana TaxID=72520 RepID=W7THC8_9STRA|nr:hypothetical protein Naga_100877g2 [Nannochloropsis gaditana]